MAQNDTVEHLGRPLLVDVLANDTEPDGEALTVQVLSHTCSGTVSESLGLLTLTPDQAQPEDCTITYRIFDERGANATATVTVSVISALFFDGFETGDTSAWSTCEGCVAMLSTRSRPFADVARPRTDQTITGPPP